MIIDSFDNKTKPIATLKDFYGEQKHLIEKCLIVFSKKIYDYILRKYKCELIGSIGACNGHINIYKFNYENIDIASI